MNIRTLIAITLTSTALSASGWALERDTPLSTAFTYQGELKLAGAEVSGTADFQFTLWDALSGPTQVAGPVAVNNVAVADGLFTIPIDFGSNVFNGEARWLEIAVRSPAGAGAFTTLSPRQPIAAAPYALQTRGIFVDDAGRVGIGTTSPDTLLHLSDTGPVMILQDTASAANQAGYLGFWNDASAETGWVGFGTPGSPTFSVTNQRPGGNLRFLTQGVERMTISSSGNVGIGTTPTAKLTVDGVMTIFGPDDDYLQYSLGRVIINISDPDGSSETLMDFRVNTFLQGNITVLGSTVSYNGFMGSHYAWMDGEHSTDRGALVRMTGENRRLNGSAKSDVVYGIEPTASANDPACLGSYLGIMESDKPADLANPHLIAAIGNGEMWVVDGGRGDIEPGEYLISSDVPGCAMKDDPARFPVSHIVAQAAERVQWNDIPTDETGFRRANISVLFEKFDRHSEQNEIAALRAEIAELKAFVHQLTSSRKGGAK